EHAGHQIQTGRTHAFAPGVSVSIVSEDVEKVMIPGGGEKCKGIAGYGTRIGGEKRMWSRKLCGQGVWNLGDPTWDAPNLRTHPSTLPFSRLPPRPSGYR